jgi:hypothetical protein
MCPARRPLWTLAGTKLDLKAIYRRPRRSRRVRRGHSGARAGRPAAVRHHGPAAAAPARRLAGEGLRVRHRRRRPCSRADESFKYVAASLRAAGAEPAEYLQHPQFGTWNPKLYLATADHVDRSKFDALADGRAVRIRRRSSRFAGRTIRQFTLPRRCRASRLGAVPEEPRRRAHPGPTKRSQDPRRCLRLAPSSAKRVAARRRPRRRRRRSRRPRRPRAVRARREHRRQVAIGLLLSNGFPVPVPFFLSYLALYDRLVSGGGNASLPAHLQVLGAPLIHSQGFPVDAARNDVVRQMLKSRRRLPPLPGRGHAASGGPGREAAAARHGDRDGALSHATRAVHAGRDAAHRPERSTATRCAAGRG